MSVCFITVLIAVFIFSREQPQENTTTSLSMNEDEQWFDCDTSVDLKEGQRTPVRRSTTYQCPPAPCRNGLKFQASVDHLDFDDSDDDDTSESNESGICPLEGSFEGSFVVQETKKSHVTKRQRREEKREQTTMQSTSLVESKFSELHYLEATGSVSINRQPSSSDEMEKRECKLLVSYRVHKEDPDVIQIALVVYKSNSKNLKTRRNLMPEFASKASSSKCRTAVKDREVFDATAFGSSSAPPGAKSSKCVKRKMNPVRL